MGRKKKIQEVEQEVKEQVPKYTCRWCGVTKPMSRNFFKCSVDQRGIIKGDGIFIPDEMLLKKDIDIKNKLSIIIKDLEKLRNLV